MKAGRSSGIALPKPLGAWITALLMLFGASALKAWAEPPGWSRGTPLSSPGSESLCPSVTSVGEGTVAAIWSGFEGDSYQVFFCAGNADEGKWDSARVIVARDSDCLFPVAAVIDSTIYCAWIQSVGEQQGYIVFTRSLDTGQSWESPQAISGPQPRTTSVRLAASGSTVHLIWTDARVGIPTLWYAVSSDGGDSWSSHLRITSQETYCWYPDLAASGSGVYLVWEDWRHDTPEVYFACSLDRGETWRPAFPLSWVDKVAAERPRVTAIDSRLDVVWQEDPGDGSRVMHSYSNNRGGSWFTKPVTAGAADIRLPVLAIHENRLLLAGQADISGVERIYLLESPDRGTTWSEEASFTSPGGAWSGLPALTCSGTHALLAWTDLILATRGVWMSQQPAPAGSSTPFWLLY